MRHSYLVKMHKATAYKYSLDVRILLEPLSVLPYLGTGSPSEAGALAADRDHLDATPFCKKSTKCHDHKRAYARTHPETYIHKHASVYSLIMWSAATTTALTVFTNSIINQWMWQLFSERPSLIGALLSG